MGTTVFYYMYVYGCYIYPCACKSSGWPFIGLLYKRIHCAKLGWTWSLPFLYHDITSPALTPSPAWMRFLKGGLEKTSNTLLLIYIQFVKVVIKNQISEIIFNSSIWCSDILELHTVYIYQVVSGLPGKVFLYYSE